MTLIWVMYPDTSSWTSLATRSMKAHVPKCFYLIFLIKLLFKAARVLFIIFFKRELYPISHTALIMDCFSRSHLYGVPRVTVSSFASKLDRTETTDYALSATFYIIPIRYSERELWCFYQGHFFEMNFRSLQKPLLPQIISPKILRNLIWNLYWSFLMISASPHKHFIF